MSKIGKNKANVKATLRITLTFRKLMRLTMIPKIFKIRKRRGKGLK